jgi:hypothetical protein
MGGMGMQRQSTYATSQRNSVLGRSDIHGAGPPPSACSAALRSVLGAHRPMYETSSGLSERAPRHVAIGCVSVLLNARRRRRMTAGGGLPAMLTQCGNA